MTTGHQMELILVILLPKREGTDLPLPVFGLRIIPV